jgi:DNA-binding IclR family transcriptional regulator
LSDIQVDSRPLSETFNPRDPVALRILTVLEACAETRRPITITEIVEQTGLAKSTVHRMCWKLEELGMLSYTDGRFLIGTKLITIANANPVVTRLRATAIPYLVQLQECAGASNLAILNGNNALILDNLYKSDLRQPPRVGTEVPLHTTAVGKAMLAHLPADRLDEFLRRTRLTAATPRSIVHPDVLRRNLAAVTERGYAISFEEFRSGIVSVAAAFDVSSGMLAAIGCVGLSINRNVLASAKQIVQVAEQLQQAFADRSLSVTT